jgi:hypothetical protein
MLLPHRSSFCRAIYKAFWDPLSVVDLYASEASIIFEAFRLQDTEVMDQLCVLVNTQWHERREIIIELAWCIFVSILSLLG